MPKVSNDSLSLYRGTEEKIASAEIQNGAIYFSTDTDKIMFDADNSRHIIQSGSDVSFYLGNEYPIQDENVMDNWLFDRTSIDANNLQIGDVILNIDNKFYRVVDIDTNEKVACVMIAGGGGGGSGPVTSGRRFSITSQTSFPQMVAAGYNAAGIFRITSNMSEDTYAQVHVTIGEKDSTTSTTIYNQRELPVQTVPVGKDTNFTIEIPSEYLTAKYVSVIIQPSVEYDDTLYTNKISTTIQVLSISLQASNTWNPRALFNTTGNNLDYSYDIIGKDINSTQSIHINFYIDGAFATNIEELTTSGTAHLSSTVVAQTLSHGAHTLEVVASMTLYGNDIELNRLSYEFMWIKAGELDPIIVANYNNTEELNYSLISIPHMVYVPNDVNPDVHYIINGEELISGAVKRPYNKDNYYVWEITEYEPDTINTFTIKCGTVEKSFAVNIIRDDSRNLDAISDNLLMYLSASGRSNSENSYNRSRWPNGKRATGDTSGITFTGFNWYNNGWIKDEDNHSALRLSNGAKLSIPLDVMSGETQSLTFEVDFKIKNTTNYQKLVYVEMEDEIDPSTGLPKKDAEGENVQVAVKKISDGRGIVGSYLQGGIGLAIGAQETYFKGSTQIVNVQYPDEERVKVSTVLDATTRRIYIYINGVITGVVEFSNRESFQSGAKEFVFNSDFCDIDIYNIRIYTTALDYNNIIQNWIGDAPDLQSKRKRYTDNSIYDVIDNKVVLNYRKVMESKLIPVMVITTYNSYNKEGIDSVENNFLPYKKKNKKAVAVRYFDPEDITKERTGKSRKSFRAMNCSLDVQGTSSQNYPRRNYKLKLKLEGKNDTIIHPFRMEYWDGTEPWRDQADTAIHNTNADGMLKNWQWFEDSEGNYKPEFSKYLLGTHDIAETSFCLKADYMESSSTHNTCMADYVGYLCNTGEAQNTYGHPLNRLGIVNRNDAVVRTTIYGFPILLFHEDAETGDVEYVGKYNFNLDKGATSSFGFTNKSAQPFIDKIPKYVKEPEQDKFLVIEHDSNDDIVYDTSPTYETVSECWELKNNQSGGRATFELDPEQFYATEDGTDGSKLQWINDFEARYHISDFDQADVYAKKTDIPVANKILNSYTSNFFELYKWIYSTNVNAATNQPLSEPVYLSTLDRAYNSEHNYYRRANGEKINFEARHITITSTGISINQDTFVNKVARIDGSYSFVLSGNDWLINNEKINLADYGIAVTGDKISSIDVRVISAYYEVGTNNTWSASLLEQYTIDNQSYRLAKFKSEFELHFNKAYSAMYAVLTEFLIMYDSRAKNMMLATWGPEQVGGNYIWYPIFYDMDTQLGVNNSGVVYWDYDVNPTPDEGEDATPIYSGATSVLWNNFHKVFGDDIKSCYRFLRGNGLDYQHLVQYYDENGSDKWTEIMKNLDAYYKYILPAEEGYINTEGVRADPVSSYFYCLQGDRKLTRDLLFRNRLNYMDSRWQAGAYDTSGSLSANIQFRYNLNDATNTSDKGANLDNPEFDAIASFSVRPYLTQYLMVFYDQAVSKTYRYDVQKETEPMTIQPVSTIEQKQNGTQVATQQLAYINGPGYLADLGDLSRNYLNDFFSERATKLNRIVLGNERAGYTNLLLNDSNLHLNGSATTSSGGVNTGAKTLLQYLDISNLSALSTSLDLTGCTKLDTLKALGTRLEGISIPAGNVIRTMYLPETIKAVELIQPRYLSGVLTDYAQDVQWKDEYAINDTRPQGLYIQGFTDHLDDTISSNSLTKINTFSVENTLLKYYTYKMAKRLFDIKTQMAQNLTEEQLLSYSPRLEITLLDVDWSPYIAVEEGTPCDRSGNTKYYYRNGNMTYSRMMMLPDTDAAWNNELINVGVYTRETENSPIISLYMLDKFIADYEDNSIRLNDQLFVDTVRDSAAVMKSLPRVTGNLHISNTSETPLDEYILFSKYTRYYPDLIITADNVKECKRINFIEYKNNRKTTLYTQKARLEDSTATQFVGEEPSRLHYDFLGWAKLTAALQSSNGIVKTDAEDDGILKTTVDIIPTDELQNITITENVDYIAVFELHKYNVVFYDGDGENPVIVRIKSGYTITEPVDIPAKNESELDTYRHYHFIGYGLNDGTNNCVDLSKVVVLKEGLTYYAKFQEENVYDNPLDDRYLRVATVTNNGVYVVAKDGVNLKGKVCIPKYLNGVKVIGVNGATATTGNGFYNNRNITMIFFQGANDNTCFVSSINSRAFANMSNLTHIDLPDSVLSIEESALAECNNLQLTTLNKVRQISRSAFANTGLAITQPTLQISGKLEFVRDSAFSNAGWQTINIGSSNDRASISADSIATGAFGGVRMMGQGENYLKVLNIYSDGTITSASQLAGKVKDGANGQAVTITILS